MFQGALAATAEEDVARCLASLNGSAAARTKALDDLAWEGISDPGIYEPIEQHLLRGLAVEFANADLSEVEHEVRALGFSGQAKYKATLKKVQEDLRFAYHAKTAIGDIDYYARWNPVISNRGSWDSRYSDDDNRILNMLHSNDLLLKRVAAKRVYFDIKDQVLLDALAEEIKANDHIRHKGDEGDAVAWLVKALGSTGKPQYRSLFEDAAAHSPDHEVEAHANRVLSKYYPNP